MTLTLVALVCKLYGTPSYFLRIWLNWSSLHVKVDYHFSTCIQISLIQILTHVKRYVKTGLKLATLTHQFLAVGDWLAAPFEDKTLTLVELYVLKTSPCSEERTPGKQKKLKLIYSHFINFFILTFTHGSRILCAEESEGCQLLRATAIL